jgi:hypothetical protein
VQNPSQKNGDNVNSVRHETSTDFRNKIKEYPKYRINELKETIRTKISIIYRGINEFKKAYQLRTNLVKDENGDLLPDSHSILNRRLTFVKC